MIGDEIKRRRTALGMTQTELATQIGVYQSDIARWEGNRSVPRMTTLFEIAKALHCSVDEWISSDTLQRQIINLVSLESDNKKLHQILQILKQ